jgi:hypothetical protein
MIPALEVMGYVLALLIVCHGTDLFIQHLANRKAEKAAAREARYKELMQEQQARYDTGWTTAGTFMAAQFPNTGSVYGQTRR